MNKFEQNNNVSLRNRRYASRLARRSNIIGSRGNLSKVLSKIVSNHDPLLSVGKFEKFIVENAMEFENVCNAGTYKESSSDNETADSNCESVNLLSSVKDKSCPPASCDGANVSLNIDDTSIVTPNPTTSQVDPETLFCTGKKNKWIKKRRFMEMENATSLEEYAMLKYGKGERQFKKRRFGSKQLLHLRKIRNPCYRKYLAIKYPHTINLNLHKYRSIRKSYIVNFPVKRKLELSKVSEILFKRWQRKKLPKIQHNSELLRELTFHWSEIREKHHEMYGGRLPDVTVSAVDTIATAIQVFIRNEIAKLTK